jgi:hypothetical protein
VYHIHPRRTRSLAFFPDTSSGYTAGERGAHCLWRIGPYMHTCLSECLNKARFSGCRMDVTLTGPRPQFPPRNVLESCCRNPVFVSMLPRRSLTPNTLFCLSTAMLICIRKGRAHEVFARPSTVQEREAVDFPYAFWRAVASIAARAHTPLLVHCLSDT